MSSDKATLDGLRIDRTAPNAAPKRPWLLPVILAIALAGAVSAWWLQRPRAMNVQTAVARAQAGGGSGASLNASGYVTARRSATVSSKVTGKVTEVLVEEGKTVEAGQVLARLDASNVQASLRLAQAQLERAKRMMEEMKPNLAFALQELKRFTDLATTRAVSDSELRRSEMDARTFEARLARLMAEIEVAESEVAQWQQQLDDTIIRAPFPGIVTSKNAQPGEMISPMSVGGFTRTGICTVVDMSSLEIEVDVNESYINRVHPGRPVEATLDAYADWRIPAKVIAIIPTADRQKATVKVRVGFDQLDPRILPEMAVKVAFLGGEADAGKAVRGSVAIPTAAVRRVDGRDIVWIVRNSRAERRAVTLGRAEGEETTVAAGLESGERVVLDAPPELAEGARLRSSDQ